MRCKICRNKKTTIFWNAKIRGKKDIFKFLPNKTNKKSIDIKKTVYKCNKCEVVFLKNQSYFFETESNYNNKKIYKKYGRMLHEKQPNHPTVKLVTRMFGRGYRAGFVHILKTLNEKFDPEYKWTRTFQ